MEAVSTNSRRWFVAAGTLVIIGIAAIWCVFHTENPIAFAIGMRHVINQEERFLLTEVDHKLIAQVLREFAQKRGWTRLDLSAGDPNVPKELQVLKPSAVWLYEDHVELDFGGAFLSFGFRVFKPGIAGYGTKKIDEGFWFYSDDNRVPTDE
jgi:hypothetical protein